jgi:hypothetical protein
VQSGDKPAAAQFVFFIKSKLRLQAIETINQSSKITAKLMQYAG